MLAVSAVSHNAFRDSLPHLEETVPTQISCLLSMCFSNQGDTESEPMQLSSHEV